MELFLEGQFDESGNDRCSIGTFKTLRDDAEACRLMGQLCGVLMYHTAKYVNENLHRYTAKAGTGSGAAQKIRRDGKYQ